MTSRREGQPIRVLIVDDHRLFADAIMTTLQDQGIQVLDIASSGAEAVTLARKHLPEIVLLDIGLPDRSGLSVGKELLDDHPDVRIIALTGIEDPQLVRETARVGFRGYLRKDSNVQEFVEAVRRTVSGETVFPNGYKRFIRRRPAWEEDTDSLSNRELQVLALLAEGASSQRVAEALDISTNTVRTHVQSILTKLQVHSRLQAVAFAVRHDLLADQDRLGA
jgi:DNA-binding NarL/FixJ family response regulator